MKSRKYSICLNQIQRLISQKGLKSNKKLYKIVGSGKKKTHSSNGDSSGLGFVHPGSTNQPHRGVR